MRLVLLVTFVRLGISCSLLSQGATRLAQAKSFHELVINVGALAVILDVPKIVWAWGCNGGLWTRLLDVEARISFSECLLETNWSTEQEIHEEGVQTELKE